MIMETHNKCWIKGYNEGIKKALKIVDKASKKNKYVLYEFELDNLKQLLEKEIK